ncbi:serine/threonine-protein kinase [Gracilimonas mengyeensis]|uniref:Serine/threonine protein kinase with TPR repeats n=1 Tax=Gracilimonas mengyeensis TaxID=1302730 RepID=A0A521EZG4_9BACT|nr:serine/threonine-protein kinase [Gracilimonas mengyeensis]SMO89253.1 serine/threonine protein kinase with TPR repeats [Gracilimonas mengyeensis]
MKNDRWQEVSDILDTLLTLPKEKQLTYLEDNFGGDQQLVQEVKDMLKAISESEKEAFLTGTHAQKRTLLAQFSKSTDHKLPQEQLLGEKVGPYQIEKLIAEGGMGNVYKAERVDGQFEQTVAVKFINHRNVNESIIQRFRQEQKILANLNHPNIASILDGGITESGFPYLIMEYINGRPIDEYCNRNQLNVKQRLRLFRKVLRVIDYAHSKLVVHRDLKPNNIFVMADGTVKILDFGIAKLLDDESAENPLLTQTGQRLWTPHYAAPEQVLERPSQLQTDVYAAGILLYRLLTGCTPYNFDQKSLHEIEATILKETAPLPSQIVSANKEFSYVKNFGQPKQQIERTLKHELDAIACKAIRKEPDDRYSSISSFLDDLERYQKKLSVSAVRDGIIYRTRKFMLRNRKPLSYAAAVLLIIGSMVAYYTVQLNQQRRAAEAEAEKATQISGYLSNLFAQNYPENAKGEDISASQLLDQGIKQLNSLDGQPEVQAAMLNLFAHIHQNIEELDTADSLAQKAIQVAQSQNEENSSQLASSFHTLALVERGRGNYDKSIEYFNRSLELEGPTNTPADSNYAARLSALAYVLRLDNNLDEAAQKNKEAITIQKRLYGETNIELAESLYIQASILRVLGRFEEALKYQLDSYNMVKELVEPPHPGLSANLSNLALLMERTGDYAAAEKYSRQSLEMNIQLYGENHSEVASSLRNIASSLNLQNKHAEALPYLERALDVVKKAFPSTHLHWAYTYNDLGNTYINLEQLEKAEPLLLKSLEIKRTSLGEKHLSVTATLNNLAELKKRKGEMDEARDYLQQSLEVRTEILGEGHEETKEVVQLISKLGD